MQKLSFYSFYDYYTPDYLQFVNILSARLGGTIHVSYFDKFYSEMAIPEKHFINFFQSDLFYIKVYCFVKDNQNETFYTLSLSSGIPELDNLKIHFLRSGVIRIFGFYQYTYWDEFVDLLFTNTLDRSLLFRTLRAPYVFKFLRTLSKLDCSNLYFFPSNTYSFEDYLNNALVDKLDEKDFLVRHETECKIKLYSSHTIAKYLQPNLQESLLIKRKNKISKYGVLVLSSSHNSAKTKLYRNTL